jgi:hypothetical protein
MRGARHVRLPLNLKLSALIVSLLAVTVLFVSGFLLRAQQATLTEEMRKRGLTLAQNLAAGARSALLTKDDLALALLVRDAMRDGDVAYVAITDRNGKVVAHSDQTMVGRQLERRPDEGVVDFAAPLTFREVRIGAAYVGFSQAGIREAVAHARARAILVTLAMLAVGIAGFGMLATGEAALILPGALLAFAAGWGWPGLFNFAVVKTSPGHPAAATGVTQTGASGGAALGPLVFGLVVEAASYDVAWLVSGAFALGALGTILAGRRLVLRDRGRPFTNLRHT